MPGQGGKEGTQRARETGLTSPDTAGPALAFLVQDGYLQAQRPALLNTILLALRVAEGCRETEGPKQVLDFLLK